MKLLPIEFALLNEIIDSNIFTYPYIAEHLLSLSVSRRECTVVGYYVYFNYDENHLYTPNIELMLFGDKMLFISGFPREVSYVLYITNGKIDCMEIVSNGDEVAFDKDLSLYEFKLS